MKYIKNLSRKNCLDQKIYRHQKNSFISSTQRKKMAFIKDTLNKDKKYIDTKRTFLSQLKGRSAKLDTGRKSGHV